MGKVGEPDLHNNAWRCVCSEIGESVIRINDRRTEAIVSRVEDQRSNTGKVGEPNLHNNTWRCVCSEVGETVKGIYGTRVKIAFVLVKSQGSNASECLCISDSNRREKGKNNYRG